MRPETKTYRTFSIVMIISAIVSLIVTLQASLGPGAFLFTGILFGLGLATFVRVFRLVTERKAEEKLEAVKTS
jgi:hypothetical protein